MSSDGSIVAIGAIENNDNGFRSGHVRVYENVNGTWTQLGSDIDGEAPEDRSGHSVSLSSDGTIVAIGAQLNHDNGSNSGHVRVYEYGNDTWTQLGFDIDGEAKDDKSGYSVSLSSDGSIVAIGARENDDNGDKSGHVRVYTKINKTPLNINQETTMNITDAADSSISASDLSAIGAKTSGVVTVENAVHITGDHEEVTDALVTDATKVEVTDAKVTINDDADTNIHATELSAIGAKTSSVVTVENDVHITGDHEEVTDALVTDATKVEVTDAKVTINDDADTAIDATELTNIGHKTNGNITITNRIHIKGSATEVEAAIDDVDTFSANPNADVTLTSDPTLPELVSINNKISGTITLKGTHNYDLALSGTTADVKAALDGDFAEEYEGNVTLTDTVDVVIQATDITTIEGDTNGTVTVSHDMHIKGTSAEVAAAVGHVNTFSGIQRLL